MPKRNKEDNSIIIPVLPIPDVVFFPHTALPLYIEEHSYVKMIHDCIENDIPIAVSLAQPLTTHSFHKKGISKTQYRPSGVSGYGTPFIIESYENKAVKVLIRGVGKVILKEPVQSLPYPTFRAEYLHDREENIEFNNNAIQRINTILQNWVSINVTNSVEQEAFYSNLKSVFHVVDYVAMLMIQDRDIKQVLLETDSLFERVSMLNALLDRSGQVLENLDTANAIKHFEFIEKISKIGH